jgi:hypothetical protein
MTYEEAMRVLEKYISVENPSPAVVREVKQALQAQPGAWHGAGDMVWQIRRRLIDAITPQYVAKESIEAGWNAIAARLGRQDQGTPALERLLIDQVLVSWLHLYYVHMAYMGVIQEGLTMAQGNYWEKRLSRAQGRYLKAIETLARVRRLTRPEAVQVNIATQQINTVGNLPEMSGR